MAFWYPKPVVGARKAVQLFRLAGAGKAVQLFRLPGARKAVQLFRLPGARNAVQLFRLPGAGGVVARKAGDGIAEAWAADNFEQGAARLALGEILT